MSKRVNTSTREAYKPTREATATDGELTKGEGGCKVPPPVDT